jgi:hypothetical protein
MSTMDMVRAASFGALCLIAPGINAQSGGGASSGGGGIGGSSGSLGGLGAGTSPSIGGGITSPSSATGGFGGSGPPPTVFPHPGTTAQSGHLDPCLLQPSLPHCTVLSNRPNGAGGGLAAPSSAFGR